MKSANYESIQQVCKNCMDFDKEESTCTIRYLILLDKTKVPLPRKPNQKWCNVFMLNQ